MRILIAVALAVSFAASAFAQPADTRPELQQRLIAVAAQSGYGTEGSQFGLDGGVPAGKSVRYAFALKAGETYLVVGGCDANCTNMALLMTDANSAGVAYSEDGQTVAFTKFGQGAHPSFTMTAAKTTTYSIVIHVETCTGPGSMCVAGAAVFHKDGAAPAFTPVKTDKFEIDAAGMIHIAEDFTDEMYCVLDTIEDDTAEAAGAALAKDTWPADIDKDFQSSRAACAVDYDWSDREGQLAIIMASTQLLLNHATDLTKAGGVDYDDVVEIEDMLSEEQRARFHDGSWLQDKAMIATLEKELKARGLNDPALINFGEMAVGAQANQHWTVREWVDLLTPK